MPTPTKGARLGGSPAHQKAILSNLATSLFEHGAITTTEAKARRLRPFAEKLISKAKRGDLHNRRQVLSVVQDKGIVHLLFTEIGPRYAARPGGYTRITKIGPRKGDNAPMAVIELVQEEVTSKRRSTKKAAPAPGRAAKRTATAEPRTPVAREETAAEDTVADETPAEDTPAEDTAADETAADETADDTTAADETVAETTAAEEATTAAEAPDADPAAAASVDEAAGAEDEPVPVDEAAVSEGPGAADETVAPDAPKATTEDDEAEADDPA